MAYRIASTLALAVTLIPACEWRRGDTLDEFGGDECVEKATVLAGLDAATALGFTAADVLAAAEGPHMSPMTWSKGLAEGPEVVEFGPESGAGELTVAIHYAGGEVRLIESTPAGGGGNEADLAADCHGRLEIDVEVAVDTAGGALAEKFVAPLRATARGIASLRHSIEFADLQGSLALTKVDPPDAEVGPLDLDIGISPSGLFGSASAQVTVKSSDWVGVTFMNLATWPSGSSNCELGFGEAPVALGDAIAGFSAADALARVAAADSLALTWEGADPTALTLELTHDGAPVCALYDSASPGALRFGATAAVATADGRWHGAFPVEVSARPAADGTLESVYVYIPAPYASTVPAAEFAASFGLDDIDLAGYDEAALDFGGEFFPDGFVDGKLDVLGVINHMCSDQPGAPCEGNEYVTLATATWSSQ